MIQSALRICGLDPFVERPSPARHGAYRIFCLLRASLLGGTALALLIGLGSGAWAQAQSQSVAGGAATGVAALAVGTSAKALSQSSTALGYLAVAGSNSANGDYTTALGAGSSATLEYSTAVGDIAVASGVGSSAMGYNARAYGQDATAVGNSAVAGVNGDKTVIQGTTLGASATATASNATALGYGAKATVANSVALGANSVAGAVDNAPSSMILGGVTYKFSGTQNVSVLSIGGTQSDGSTINRQIQNVAPGLLSSSSTDAVNGSQLDATNQALNTTNQTLTNRLSALFGVVYGDNSVINSLALGPGSTAGVSGNSTLKYYATALGVNSQATGAGSTAVGYFSQATNSYTTTVGYGSQASGSGATAIGHQSQASGTFATALGKEAHANFPDAMALGAVAQATANNATALGYGAQATMDNSVALGAGSVTGDAHASSSQTIAGTSYAFSGGVATDSTPVVSVGGLYNDVVVTRQIQNVAAGLVSSTSTDAVNGSQLYSTNTAIGDVNNRIGAVVTVDPSDATKSLVSVAGSGGATRKVVGVAPGDIGATSTDAVNGSQLYATNQSILATDAKIGAVVSGSDVSVADRSTGATRKIVNVAPGAVSATSTDAVNGSQLNITNQNISTILSELGGFVGSAGVGSYSLALGLGSTASGVKSVALGYGASATTDNSVALGANSVTDTAHDVSSVQISGTTTTFNSTATSSTGVVSVGGKQTDGSTITRQIQYVAPGLISSTSTDAVNGSQLQATNDAVEAVNTRVTTVSDRVTVVEGGLSALTSAIGGFKAGNAAGANALALGANSSAGADNSVALGAGSGTGSVHTGPEAKGVNLIGTQSIFAGAPKDSSGLVSVGTVGNERQIQNVAAGRVASDSTDAVNGSQLNAAYGAIGSLGATLNSVTNRLGAEKGVSSSAYGNGAAAGKADGSTSYDTAMGASAGATGGSSTAIGYNAQASTPNSVAIGANSTTGVAVAVASGTVGGQTYNYAGAAPVGVVSVGGNTVNGVAATRQVQNVAAGRIAADSTDAVNGSQLYASNQAINSAMSQSVAGLGQSLDALASSVNQLSNRVGVVQKEARGGIAAAVALVNAPMPSQPGKTSWAGNVAKFRDQYAMGVSLSHRLNANIPLAMTAGFAYTPGTSDVTGRFGMAGEF